MSQKWTVDAVIVTYNRLNLLEECLKAVIQQSYAVNHIFVIDNDSSDDTWAYLKSVASNHRNVIPVHLKKNIGGAGGFNRGLRLFAEKSDSDFVWAMDDDTIPLRNALERLMDKIDVVPNVGFLASNVRWTDGSTAIMNIPSTARSWNSLANKGMIKVKSASFVSILFSREVVKKLGLPISDFFIWRDDVEYTLRITKSGYAAFMISDSIVIHKMAENKGTNIALENDTNRLKRYYFDKRNAIYNCRYHNGKKALTKALISQLIIQPIVILKKSKTHKLYKIGICYKGTLSGLFFNPKIEKPCVHKENKI